MSLQTATAEINPYASPAVADRLMELDEAGIGVWRDGHLLVLHKAADLPAVCVRTGLPASRLVPLRVAWFRSAWQLRLEHLPMKVPMCSRWAFYSIVGRRTLMALGLTIAGALGALCVVAQGSPATVQAFRLGAFGGLAFVFGALLGAVALGEPLQFVRARGNYLWFRGAHQRFLQHLPEWTYGK
jgi:hypothetical protein